MRLERTDNGKDVEGYGLKGTDGFGLLSSSGSFAALRMTAGTGNSRNGQQQEWATAGMGNSRNGRRQEQPQVLRLRCSQSAVSNFAQDDKIL